jgi:RimJ/RimL family protein N-acetyltransferase
VDFARLIAWSDSPEALRQWAGRLFDYPLDERQLDDYLRSAGPTRMIFTVVDGGTGEPVGHVELDRIEPGASAHVGRVIVAPARRGQGLGTALVEAVCRLAFEELGVGRVTLNVYEWNVAAIASYEKVGFRLGDLHRAGDKWAYYSMELARAGRGGRPSIE